MTEQIKESTSKNSGEHIVVTAEGYDRIDGRNAYRSDVKRLTLGKAEHEDNEIMQIAAALWKQAEGDKEGNQLEIMAELPIHQVLDMAIFTCRTLQYFRSAYRLPLLYDPENPRVDRIGLQGDAMEVSICTENDELNQDIVDFAQAVGEQGELLGERLRTLSRILEELEY